MIGNSVGRQLGSSAPRVISDCHFGVQLNHFIPGLLLYSVTVFLKWQSYLSLIHAEQDVLAAGVDGVAAAHEDLWVITPAQQKVPEANVRFQEEFSARFSESGEGALGSSMGCEGVLWGPGAPSEKGVRLTQKMEVGPCIPVGIQLERRKMAQLLGQLGVFLTPRDPLSL